MKPEDFKIPDIHWEAKQIAFCDKVLYLPPEPKDPSAFNFVDWKDPLLFATPQPLHLEYCSGNGAWILSKAKANPHLNWIAVEKRFDRVRKICAKIHNHQLTNLIVVFGEAMQFSNLFLRQASIDHLYINFPDPWPKKRHAKNRLLVPAFIQELHRTLSPTGSLDFVTDDNQHSQEVIGHFLEHQGWFPRDPNPYFTHEYPGYGDSFFENLWREKGKSIRYHQFRKELFNAS